MSRLDDIEQLCRIALEDIQKCFDIKENLWKYVEKEIKPNESLMKLIEFRQSDFDWKDVTVLGGPGTSLNGVALYCLIRHFDMGYVIETGVSGGYYTSFMLSALSHSKDYPVLTSLELSDDMTKVGKLIPQSIKDLAVGDQDSEELEWNLKTGRSSLEWFKDLKKEYPTIRHNADLYSHDSLHTLKHMLLELNEFKQSISDNFIVFVDDERSDNFWNWCIDKNQFKKTGYSVKWISGQESRLNGHLGGFIKFTKIYK